VVQRRKELEKEDLHAAEKEEWLASLWDKLPVDS